MTKRVFNGAEARKIKEELLSLHLREGTSNEKYAKEYKKRKTLEAEDLFMLDKLLPTVHSDLINCQYYLQVEVVHKGMTLGSKLKPAVLPIYIFTPIAPIELHKQVKPLVWNPKVFQLTQFIVPEQQFASQYQKYMNLPG